VDKDGLFPIGKIIGAHGIKGNLKVLSYAETVSVFTAGKVILVRNKNGQQKAYSIQWASPYKKGALLSLNEINDRDQAEILAGSEIFIRKSDLPKLEEGAYYWFDLIGLFVWTTDGQMIGRIESIIDTGSNDVYVVKNKDSETLVPAIESVVLEINLNQHIMRVNLPDGL